MGFFGIGALFYMIFKAIFCFLEAIVKVVVWIGVHIFYWKEDRKK